MTQLNLADLKRVIAGLKAIMDAQRDRLIEIDNVLGDGDLGLTMTKAFTAAAAEASASTETVPGRFLMRLGMAMAKAAPSTMGTLVGTGFMRGGKALGDASELGVPELATFFRGFSNGLIERGKTAPGNKTIVDALDPAATALESAATSGATLPDALADASTAARSGADAAKQMKASHGRAAYFGDQTIGVTDGGAEVGVLILQGFANAAPK